MCAMFHSGKTNSSFSEYGYALLTLMTIMVTPMLKSMVLVLITMRIYDCRSVSVNTTSNIATTMEKQAL